MISLLLAAAVAASSPGPSAVKALVLAELKDPASARFTGLKPLKGKDGKVNGYCGRVNARNSFGGYTGDSVFYVELPERKVTFLPPEVSEASLC